MNRYNLLLTSLFVYSSALSMYKTPESLSSLPCLIDLKEDEIIDKTVQYLDTKKSIINQLDGIERTYLNYKKNYNLLPKSGYYQLIQSLKEWLTKSITQKQRLLLFHESCRNKKITACGLIIQACNNEIEYLISTPDYFGWNALHIAVSVQSYDMVKTILEYCVKTNLVENVLMMQSINRKKTPYHLAVEAACCTEGGQQILKLVTHYVDCYCPGVKQMEYSSTNTPCDDYLEGSKKTKNKILSEFLRNTH